MVFGREILLGLTQELGNNVDAKRLAAGYHRGAEKPVRSCGSPTCSLLAFPQGSNWRDTEK
ncbi:hypothetical protein [Nostoc sp. ChiSLP03a]|uniref:hypothetical protein n=1 Tax=Nostoc sp. ChiSLP03a TaxID=3075380 RepID=UPI002AD56E2D|nr:hypothetical protein [Nostoc sp. ChiSLP03a]MDZ8212277.1 hypothetical protein [Nostoc sp. ChiSLP03a]